MARREWLCGEGDWPGKAPPGRPSEWLCTECDWIGSPAEEPTECPRCMSGALEDITILEEGGR